MKKYAKKIFCGIALCGIALCSIGILSGFGVNAVRGYAAEEGASALANTYFEMEGATVRLSNPTGLRFTAKIDTTSYEAPTVADAENTQERTVSYGVLIFPMNVLEHYMTDGKYTNFQGYVEDYDYLKEIKENAAEYVNTYGIIDIESIPVPVDEDNDETPDYYRINGSIAKVKYNNTGREFFGLAYKKVGTYDENSTSYSYEYTYANFGNKSNVWSLSYVASAAYAKDWEGSTDTDKETLQGFIKNALLKEAGVQEEDAANVENFNWTLSLSKTATELTVGATESLTWETSFTVSGQDYAVTPDLSVKYASDDSSVVEVSADGTLSAKKAGTATITVSCMDKEATCEVTVSAAAEPELEFAKIGEVTLEQGAEGNFTYKKDDTSLAVTTTGTNKSEHSRIRFSYNGLTFTKKKLSFKVTNNSNNSNETLQLGVCIDGCNVNFVNVTNVESVSIDGISAVLVTVAAGESVIVTLTEKNSWETFKENGTISLRPFHKSTDFDGTFTISEIYNDERKAGPTKLATPVVNVDEQGLATWDAVANATSYEYIIDDGAAQSTNEIISVQLNEGQKIKVRACTTDTANYTDSDWSAEVVYDTTSYTITVNSCTASAATARAGTLITLTADEAPDGQVFDKWVVEAQEDVVITNNTFIMPACNVTVTATYKTEVTLDYLTFTEKGVDGFGDNNNITSDDKNSSITVNVTENQYPNVNAYAYMKYGGLNNETETKLTFTVTNNGDSELIIDVGTKGNFGGSGANVVNVNVGEKTVDGKGRITVAGKESVVVTVEFEKAIKDIDHGGFRLCFYPYAVNKTAANFTISKVYVGG